MSDPIDEHLDEAIASLDELTVRELEATAGALASRRHPLHEFSSIFRNVAGARGEAGAQIFLDFTSGRPSPAPTASSLRGSQMRRRRFGRTSARPCGFGKSSESIGSITWGLPNHLGHRRRGGGIDRRGRCRCTSLPR